MLHQLFSAFLLAFLLIQPQIEQNNPPQVRDQYTPYEGIISKMYDLEANFPNICKVYSMGYSVEGRELLYLKISDFPQLNETEPELLMDGGIHGDETMASENMIRFADFLCESYAVDPDITYLINNRELFIYCMVNPDGRVHITRYNANDVDLNRDYGFFWKPWGGEISPFSQPETRAVRNLMMQQNFSLHSSFHAGYEGVYYPWTYTEYHAPDEAVFFDMAKMYADASGYDTLEYGQTSIVLYKSQGSSKDYFYGALGGVAWTMEISNDKTPPVSMIPRYFMINKQPMIELMRASAYGLHGFVRDANTLQAVKAHMKLSSEHPYFFNDPENGDFHHIMTEGTYDLIVSADGYQNDTVHNIVLSAQDSSFVDIQLLPVDVLQNTAYRFLACSRAINNFADKPKPWDILGLPDGAECSLGTAGYIIFETTENVKDTKGADVKLSTNDVNGFDGYVELEAASTPDGPWLHMEEIADGTFDLASTKLLNARYFKVLDTHDPALSDSAVSIDAMEQLVKEPHPWVLLKHQLLEDENGNNRLDPGESAQWYFTLKNNGNLEDPMIKVLLTDSSSFVNISPSFSSVTGLEPDGETELVFDLEVASDAPEGLIANFGLGILFNNATDTTLYRFQQQIGEIDVAVFDLSLDHKSAPEIQKMLAESKVFTSAFDQLSDTLMHYSTAYICCGMRQFGHLMNPSDLQLIESYLLQGNALYMEGGDLWFFNNQTELSTLFGIQASSNGDDDLFYIEGEPQGFLSGFSAEYSGTNLSIDHIEAIGNAFPVLRNSTENYNVAIAHESGEYRTFGASFEWGGLPDTENDLLAVHEFLKGIYTGIENQQIKHDSRLKLCYNGASDDVCVSFFAGGSEAVQILVYTIQGELIGKMDANNFHQGWNTLVLPLDKLNKPVMPLLVSFYQGAYQESIKIMRP